MARSSAANFKRTLKKSGKDIYSPIAIGDPVYWIPTLDLELLLNNGLRNLELKGLPLRTRSKIVKSAVCEALGYPIPKTFKKTQPRFPGQQLDTYSQKSSNLQIWNEELSPTRRYALIIISADDVIKRVKVVNGQELALLDTTGTLTRKYQARIDIKVSNSELISKLDTSLVIPHLGKANLAKQSPIEEPSSGELLPIKTLFTKLLPLVGKTFKDPGHVQERNRGAELHKLVCMALGYKNYEDRGQFPDIRHQLLEVKLQTSPTIDLGLVLPSSADYLDIRELGSRHPRHCDTRYAIFCAATDGTVVSLKSLFVCTGADFFKKFRRFEGKITNSKLQIPLPKSLFER